MIDLSDKVAIVTGAAQGIGAASARTLALQGAKVALADINAEGLRERVDKLQAEGLEVVGIPTDVREENAVRDLVSATVDRFGQLDILHNNAAAMDLVGVDPGIVDLTLDVWEGTFATNARGPMLGCKYAVPAMLATGGGSIINTSSIASQSGDMSLTAYGAAKAAVSQLTRSVAAQWGKSNIRCNAVAPGLVLTPSGAALPEQVKALYLRHSLTPYVGDPQDIANLVAFLASDDARYITAQVIAADGGLVSHNPIVAGFSEWAAANA